MAKRLRKRAISIALMLTMVFTLFPTTSIIAYAAEDNTEYSLLMDQQEDEIVLESEEVFVTEENEEITDSEESETEDSSILLGLEPGMSLTTLAASAVNVKIVTTLDSGSPWTIAESTTLPQDYTVAALIPMMGWDQNSYNIQVNGTNAQIKSGSGKDMVITISDKGTFTIEVKYDYYGMATYTKNATVSVTELELVDVTGVTIKQGESAVSEITLDKDATTALTAVVAPDNATDKKVKWNVGGTKADAVKLYTDESCTNEVGADATSTLTVYAKGISAGSATVTVTSNADSTKSASCDVTVNAEDDSPYADIKNTTTEVTFDGKQWYLIEDNSTAVDAGTVTLLSKECVAASKYSSSGSYVEYASSTVKTAVDNYYTNSISSNVKTAIVDNKMFLLTRDQANAITNAEVRKCSQYSGTESNKWWLCSPGSYDFSAACVIGASGKVYDFGLSVGNTFGVRPALQVDLSKVTFASVNLSGGANATISGGTATQNYFDVGNTRGAMTTVTYTAKTGYKFPKTSELYKETNGITVTKTSDTVITVSGVPTATATSIAVPDAVTDPLADAKTSAKTDLDTLLGTKTESDYDEADWTTLTQAITDGKTAIDNATTTEAVTTAKNNAVDAVNAVKTKAQKALDNAKTSAVNTVNAVNANDYIAADQQTVTDAKTTALVAIEAATTEEEVTTALNNFNNAIASCTTQVVADQIAQVMSEVSAKTGSSVIYTGDPIQLINTPTTALPAGYTMKYAVTTENVKPTDEKLYTTEIPTKTEVGTYYVWYKVKGDDNHNDSTPACVSVTIADPVEAVIEMINALPAATNVTITDKDAIEAARAAYDALTDDQKKQISNDILKKLTDAEDKLVVLQAISEVTAKTGSDVIYTGKPVQLVNTPTTALSEGYYMKYAVTTENKAPAEESLYDASVPIAVNGGTYYVWYFVTNGQVKTEINSLTVTIVPVKDNTVTVTLNGWTYGEEPNTPVATAAYGADTATFSYSTEEEGTYTEDVPTIPGTYYVKATILENVNYNGAVSAPVKFVIEKGNQEAPAGLKANRIKPGTATGVISGVDDTMEYSVDGGKNWTLVTKDAKTIEGLSAGEVLVRRAETTNYKASESVKVVIAEYSTELTVYFAEGTESGTEQYVTYNEKERRYEHTFTGENIRPAIVVEGGGKFLTEGVDYSVSYTNNKNCSTGKEEAKVKVTGKGDYVQTKTLYFTIVKAQLSDKSIVASGLFVKESQKIEPALYFNGYKLKTSDYKVTSSTGKMTFKTTDKDPSLTFTGKGNFEGTLALPVTVIGKKDKKPSIKVTLKSGTKRTYDGTPQILEITTEKDKTKELTVMSSDGNELLIENKDFVVSYSSNINKGKVTVTVNGINNYTGTVKKTFKILADKDTSTVTAEFEDGKTSYPYVKGGLAPAVVVTAKRGETLDTLIEGIDYKVSYSGNSKIGENTAKCKVTFLGNYKGRSALTKNFSITTSNLNEADIVVGDVSRTVKSDKNTARLKYRSKVYVSIGNVKLVKDKDYKVTYYNGDKKLSGETLKFSPGEMSKTITVKVKGIGKYAGTEVTKDATYTVYKVVKTEQKVNLSNARIVANGTDKAVGKQKYIGLPITPEIDVQIKQDGKWVTVDPTTYSISYINNLNRGTATIVVNGKTDNVVGSKKANFKIVKNRMKEAIVIGK